MASTKHKIYEYRVAIIEDRGFYDDPEFLDLLNEQGQEGFKFRADQIKGSNKLAILFERESEVVEG